MNQNQTWEHVLQQVLIGLERTSLWEWLAVVTSLLYVFFSAQKKSICWLFGFLSSSIYIFLFFGHQLYLESSLQIFYAGMAIYGWMSWKKSETVALAPVIVWGVRTHVVNILISTGLTVLAGMLFRYFMRDQAYPFVDAFTTIFSLAATYMITQRVLENWIYWIIIDLVSVWLYAQRDLYLSALLMLLFTIFAIGGLLIWYRKYKLSKFE